MSVATGVHLVLKEFCPAGRVMKSFGKLAILSLLAGAVGCTEYGGGAGVVPDVTFVPADAEAAAADAGDAASVEAPAAAGAAGTFSGKVVLTGSAAALPPLFRQGDNIKDKEVCAAVDVPDERLVLGDGNGVANVFIYLAKAPKGGKPLEVPADPFLFDQKNCRFFPHCVVLPIGQTVKVLSDDSVAHNTHNYPNKNQSVNSGVAPKDREGKLEITYRRAESFPLSVKCDYHTWMTAWHLPLDHPYAAVTDAAGAFSIPDLPAGKHSFVVWHEAVDGNFLERKLAVEIKPGEATELQIDLPSEKLKL